MTKGKYGRVSLSRKTSATINPRWLILLAGKKTGDRGFTMLEVLVAIMVITFFLAGTLQLMAIDTLYKILAKQQANANQWIQEDVEEIRALAADTRTSAQIQTQTIDTLNTTSNSCPSSSNNLAGTTHDITRFTFKYIDDVPNSTNPVETQISISDCTATATNPLQIQKPTLQCKPTDHLGSYAYAFAWIARKNEITGTLLPGSRPKALLTQDSNNTNAKQYRIERDYEVKESQPAVLRINYRVIDIKSSDGTNQDINRRSNSVVARFYTEVIPASSFQCP